MAPWNGPRKDIRRELGIQPELFMVGLLHGDPSQAFPSNLLSDIQQGTLQLQLNGPTTGGFLYSDTGGDGPVVVLLHGVLMNGSLWGQVVEGLGDRYRCVIPELPFGAHRTPMPDNADLSIASLAELLAAFLEELGLEDVTLVCNDWGGAQLVYYPGGSTRVSSLVMVSCEAFDNYPPGLPGKLLCMLASLPGGVFMTLQLLRPRLIRHLPFVFGALSMKPVPNDIFLSWIRPALGSANLRRDLSKYLRNAPSSSQLLEWAEGQRSFRGRVLVIWAKEDRLMPPDHAERLSEHFENAELIWVEDSGTLIPLDQPEILANHLRSFLDGSAGSEQPS